MIIANPIYDSIFKYLLEDLDIARELISLIIGEEIVELTVKPQETTTEVFNTIRVFRLDFKATIKTKDGKLKKVLIELQKARELFDIMRFRRYLGENYAKRDDELQEKQAEYKALPIIAIYFLGFRLKNVPYPIVKVGRQFTDVVSRKKLEKPLDDDFLNLLTHETYTIQIPRLKKKVKSRIEKVLAVFNQNFYKEDPHMLSADEYKNEPLLHKMLSRLARAVASEELRRKMDTEDEIENLFGDKIKELEETQAKLLATKFKQEEAQKKQEEAQKKQEEAEKKREEAEKKKEEILAEAEKLKLEKQQALEREAEAKKEIERLKKLLNKDK